MIPFGLYQCYSVTAAAKETHLIFFCLSVRVAGMLLLLSPFFKGLRGTVEPIPIVSSMCMGVHEQVSVTVCVCVFMSEWAWLCVCVCEHVRGCVWTSERDYVYVCVWVWMSE